MDKIKTVQIREIERDMGNEKKRERSREEVRFAFS